MGASVGIDVGGTFTDIIVCPDDGGPATIGKVPTTVDQSEGLADGLARTLRAAGLTGADVTSLVHGTTVGTNALLEQGGSRIGIVTTAGFEDILYLGRAKRSRMYDLFAGADTPDYLCPRSRVRGVQARMSPFGEEVDALDEAALVAAVDDLVNRHHVEAIAVSFLFSFVDSGHEERALKLITARHPELTVSLSSRIDPRFREFERLVATAVDAYIRPRIAAYLNRVGTRLQELGVPAALQVMESHGGVVSAELVAERAVGTVLSGLAGGASGAAAVARDAGRRSVLGFDMGGTSTDVALVVDGKPLVHDEAVVVGHPLRVPTVDVHTIGAGGGSIAFVDAAGSLRVGPRSAGSVPGPAAYGRGGTEPTVTDANLVLGYLGSEGLAGGRLSLNRELAVSALRRRVAEPLGMTETEAAWGVHRIASASMSAALRVVSVARGHDPRRFAIVACGGAGPMHACTVADDLRIDEILVPPHPGVLSAYGLLSADMQVPRQRTFSGRPGHTDPAEVLAALEAVADLAHADIRRAGATGEITIAHAVDARYVGQSHELTVPVAANDPKLLDAVETGFNSLHERHYGQRDPEGMVEIVGVRATASMARPRPSIAPSTAPVHRGERSIYLPGEDRFATVPVLSRSAVPDQLDGPAVIVQEDTTVLVREGWRTELTPTGNLLLKRS
ncbi:hydantoinase/oxoprolinase family protein [Saccharopolyspora hattusasensis]|uniref:hydantoinase/oxoprolinase family protein n=1 Tax=Saccharopolyspora hattusasensis TaxID=1128679 RepID=UPI003D957766